MSIDLLRQLSRGGLHPVEHIDLIDVGIGIGLKKDVDLTGAFAGAVGGDVVHPWSAVDLLLQRAGDGAFHRDGISTGQIRRHLDRGRGDVGQVLDRQQRQGDDTRHQDQDAANGAKHRPLDERVRQAHGLAWLPVLITMPLRNWARLPITTLLLGSRPLKTG